MSDRTNPKTLQEAIQYFSDEQVCVDAVALMRWMDGAKCPDCWSPNNDKGRNPYYLKTQKRWKCRDCRRQFSVKVGTIFEDSPITFRSGSLLSGCWSTARMALLMGLHRALGVTQKDGMVHAPSAQTRSQGWRICLQARRKGFRRRRSG